MEKNNKHNVVKAVILLIVSTAFFNLVNGWQGNIVRDIVSGDKTTKMFLILLMSEIGFRIGIFFQDMFNRRTRVEIERSEEEKWQAKVESANPQAVNKITTGVILNTTSKLANLNASLVITAISAAGNVIPAVMLIIAMAEEAPLSAVISLASMLVMSVSMSIINKKKLAKRSWSVYKEAQGAFADTITNIMTVRFMGMRSFADKRQQTKNTTWSKEGVPYRKLIIRGMIMSVCAMDYVLNIYLLRNNVGLVALFTMQYYVVKSMASYIASITDLLDERSMALETLSPLKESSETPQIMTNNIVLDNIEFGYENEEDGTMMKFGIQGVEIKHGKRYTLTGESGQGKSSFANLLAGVLKANVGYVPTLDVFYVCQTITALNDTLWHNIVGANEHNIGESEVLELIDQVGMGQWFTNLKNGFETILGERGCKLSTGQVQRVNIIRAILSMRYNPEKLFILDEIVCNLDEVTKDKAIDLIDANLKSTAIIISHQDGFAEICDESLVVENHILKPAGNSIKVSRCC